MTKRFDLLIFDWDGTLMDSTAVIATALQMASADLGLPVPSEADARHIIGLGLQEAISLLQPALPEARYPDLVDRYRWHFYRQDEQLRMFDGVAKTIPHLHNAGFWVTVATGKNRTGLDHALDMSGLRQYFHYTRCAEETFSKPHPAMVLELMDLCQVPPDRTLVIGDTSHDLLMARNAGVSGVGVAYGAHETASLQEYEPLYVAESFVDLADWLDQNA